MSLALVPRSVLPKLAGGSSWAHHVFQHEQLDWSYNSVGRIVVSSMREALASISNTEHLRGAGKLASITQGVQGEPEIHKT